MADKLANKTLRRSRVRGLIKYDFLVDFSYSIGEILVQMIKLCNIQMMECRQWMVLFKATVFSTGILRHEMEFFTLNQPLGNY